MCWIKTTRSICRNKPGGATLYADNLVLIVEPTCPKTISDCAINCLDRRTQRYVKVEHNDDFRMPIPRFSRFVGQLGRLRP